GEIAAVTAAHFKPHYPTHPAWVLRDHKTDRTGKVRVIRLGTERLIDMTHRLNREYPEGPIFRNHYRRPWTTTSGAKMMNPLRKRLGLGNVTTYAVRHFFATGFLAAGGSMAHLAAIQGNSVQTLAFHYNHDEQYGQQLHESLFAFRREDASAQPEHSG